MTTKLILIRHGETEYTKERRYCGSRDIDLNDTGRKQAESLRDTLAGRSVDVVCASSMRRAVQTAEILFPGKDIIQQDGLHEINFGKWEGLKYEEVTAQWNDIYTQWVNDPTLMVIPEGESFKEMNKRVMDATYDIIKQYKDKTIAIVTHGGPVAVILCNLREKGFKEFFNLIPKVAAATEIEHG